MRKQALLLGFYLILGFLVSIPLTGSSCDNNNDSAKAEQAAEQKALENLNARDFNSNPLNLPPLHY